MHFFPDIHFQVRRNQLFTVILYFLLIFSVLCIHGCVRQKIPLTGITMPLPDVGRVSRLFPGITETDLRNQTWSQAFRQLHRRLEREYPFTDWKQIDWDALYATTAPLIEEAQHNDDPEAYYLALRSYLYSIPDGQIQISDAPEYRERAIGGGFGFAVAKLDNGQVVVHILDENGPAAHTGMSWGAEILEWNGMPVHEAIAQTPILWAHVPPATHESRQLVRQRMLTRAPAGTKADITFRNPNATEPTSVTIFAVWDNYDILLQSKSHRQYASEFDSPINYEILPSGYGYLQVKFVAPTMTMPFPVRAFRSALNQFVKEDVPGIILDVRGNIGGTFAYVPSFVGHFYSGPGFYENVAFYTRSSGTFEVDDANRLIIEPRDPYYDGEIIVLVNEATIGSGEGIPLALKRLPNAQIMGLMGTHGSFGVAGGNITMPRNISVLYPIGRSLDEAMNIQVDADAQGTGGIEPDIRLPINEHSLRMIYRQNIDYALTSAENWLDNQLGITRESSADNSDSDN